MNTVRKYAGYFTLVALLATGIGFVYRPASAREEEVCIKLSDLPLTLGKWSSKQIQLSDDVLATLGARDYLMREYTCDVTTLTLYITYFNTGSGALTHNPEKCYTATGWTFLDKKTVRLPDADRMVLQSTLARGDKRQLVQYWYQDMARVLVSKWLHIWSVAWKALAGNRMHSFVASVSAPAESPDPERLQEEMTNFSALVMKALAERLPS
jgi:EpsI family protein